jgi:hypothetical protein
MGPSWTVVDSRRRSIESGKQGRFIHEYSGLLVVLLSTRVFVNGRLVLLLHAADGQSLFLVIAALIELIEQNIDIRDSFFLMYRTIRYRQRRETDACEERHSRGHLAGSEVKLGYIANEGTASQITASL